MTKLAFVDTETTGLDPDLHEIWEVGLIVREEDHGGEREDEYRWFLPVDLGRADPFALSIGRFHERHPQGHDSVRPPLGELIHREDFAAVFADLTRGAHLVGAVISFDEERLRRLLKANGACPEWHYHLVDVENLAVGYLQGVHRGYVEELQPPWDSKALTRTLGIDPDEFDVHTALGDARWAKAIYDKVMGTSSTKLQVSGTMEGVHEHVWRLDLNSTDERCLICECDVRARMAAPILQWPIYEGPLEPGSMHHVMEVDPSVSYPEVTFRRGAEAPS